MKENDSHSTPAVETPIERRKHILWLQWLLVVGIDYLIYFNRPSGAFSYADGIALAIIAVNVGLLFFPQRVFSGSAIYFALAFFDILLVCLAVYFTGVTSDFYLFFFLVLMVTAISQNLKVLILGIVTITGVYAFIAYEMGVFLSTSGFLLRFPFLFIVGLFFGYMVYLQKVGEEKLQSERKKREEVLGWVEERYRALLDRAPLLMYVVTRNREGIPYIADCNERFLSTLGYPQEEAIGRPLAKFFTRQMRGERSVAVKTRTH